MTTTHQLQVCRYGLPLFFTNSGYSDAAVTEIIARFPASEGFTIIKSSMVTTSVSTEDPVFAKSLENSNYEDGFYITDGVYGGRGGENIVEFSGRCIAQARQLGETMIVSFNDHLFEVHPSDNDAYEVATRYHRLTTK